MWRLAFRARWIWAIVNGDLERAQELLVLRRDLDLTARVKWTLGRTRRWRFADVDFRLVLFWRVLPLVEADGGFQNKDTS